MQDRRCDALLAVLSPDVVLVSDGGGKAQAALRPVTGADNVARLLVAITATGAARADLRVEIADVNGAPGVIGRTPDGPDFAAQFVLVDGQVEQIFIIRNPDKLTGLISR